MRRLRKMRVLTLGTAAISLVAVLSPTPAEARPFRTNRDRGEPADTKPSRMPDGPINIIISIGSQRLWVYDRRGLLETSIVSTGVAGFPTPTGVFAILDKEVTHYSNIYGGASMPYMQRLTMSGVALHSGMTTGRPASHGCIRLPHAFAIKLFRLTSLGARVIIAPNEPAPVDIEHASLFARKPAPPVAAEDVDTSRAAVVAAASSFDLQKGTGDARVGKITAWRAGVLQAMPISVFVSKAAGKVFVRHGFRTLFEAPATIRNAEQPLGTHVFTATELKDDGDGDALVGGLRAGLGAGPGRLQEGVARLAQRIRADATAGRRAAIHACRSARPHRAAAAGSRAHLPTDIAGLDADRLRSRPQPGDARERHHRFHRSDALSPAASAAPIEGQMRSAIAASTAIA